MVRQLSTLCLSLFALSVASVGAQNPIATPAGKNFETEDGSDQLARGWRIGYASQFANRSDARYQYVDDELKGTLRPIQSVGFRMDNRSHTASSGAGARWTNVTLRMAETPFSSFSNTFSANVAGGSTTVFTGAVSWPTYNGYVGTPRPPAPAPLTAEHRFPFSTAWIYTGAQAIVQDYTFTGGTLNNGAAWSGANTKYFLDGAIVVTSMATGAARFPRSSTCNDSAISGTDPAQMVGQYVQYSAAFPGPKNNSIEFWLQSRYTAPNQPVIHGLSIAPLNGGTGIPLGFGCHNLIVDPSLLFVFPARAGGLPRAETPRVVVSAPRNAANLGIDIWTQGVWTDSGSNAPSLTTALRQRAPNLGMTELTPRKRLLWSAPSTATTGRLTTDISWTSHPLTFYGL